MLAYLPVLLLVAGLLTYAFSANPKAAEAGRIAYFVGLFWTVYPFVGKMVKLLALVMAVAIVLPACGFCQQAANHDTARCKAERVTVDCLAPDVIKLVAQILPDIPQALMSGDWSIIEAKLGGQHSDDILGLITCGISNVQARVAGSNDPNAAVLYQRGQAWKEAHPVHIKGKPHACLTVPRHGRDPHRPQREHFVKILPEMLTYIESNYNEPTTSKLLSVRHAGREVCYLDPQRSVYVIDPISCALTIFEVALAQPNAR